MLLLPTPAVEDAFTSMLAASGVEALLPMAANPSTQAFPKTAPEDAPKFGTLTTEFPTSLWPNNEEVEAPPQDAKLLQTRRVLDDNRNAQVLEVYWTVRGEKWLNWKLAGALDTAESSAMSRLRIRERKPSRNLRRNTLQWWRTSFLERGLRHCQTLRFLFLADRLPAGDVAQPRPRAGPNGQGV